MISLCIARTLNQLILIQTYLHKDGKSMNSRFISYHHSGTELYYEMFVTAQQNPDTNSQLQLIYEIFATFVEILVVAISCRTCFDFYNQHVM